jgi:hypothetical protein
LSDKRNGTQITCIENQMKKPKKHRELEMLPDPPESEPDLLPYSLYEDFWRSPLPFLEPWLDDQANQEPPFFLEPWIDDMNDLGPHQ